MARGFHGKAPERLYVGLEVVFTEWQHKGPSVEWHYVGPYTTGAAAKGQVRNEPEYPVWEDSDGWVYGGAWHHRKQTPSDKEGRRRVDSVVLVCEPNWTLA